MPAGDRYAWDTDGLRQGAKHKSHPTQKPTVKFASGLHGMVRRNFVTMLLLRPCDRLPPFDGFDYSLGCFSACLSPVSRDSRQTTVVMLAGNKLGLLVYPACATGQRERRYTQPAQALADQSLVEHQTLVMTAQLCMHRFSFSLTMLQQRRQKRQCCNR